MGELMAESQNKSPKWEEAALTLPSELRPVFHDLVEQYKFFASVRAGGPWVSYLILADLVRNGWRCAAKPLNPE